MSTPAGEHRHGQADGIYGTIITASVLASAGDQLAATLAATWPIVSASFRPVLVLGLARLVGEC